MLEAQLGPNRKRLAAASLLRRREKHFLFHSDVLQQTGAESSVSRAVDILPVTDGALEQGIETLVITSEITVDFAAHK